MARNSRPRSHRFEQMQAERGENTAKTSLPHGSAGLLTRSAPRASRWRRNALWGLLVAPACVASSDPNASPEDNNGGLHADAALTSEDAGDGLDADSAPDARERDAQPDLDARSADAHDFIDAQSSLDTAALDSGFYATEDGGLCFFPVSNECAPRHRAVRCGTEVCSGATPVCCRERWVADSIPVCVADGERCVEVDAGPEVPAWLVSATSLLDSCDDTSDCAADEVCADTLTKGMLAPRPGAVCASTCSPWVTGWWLNGQRGRPFSPYGWQLCANDCECLEGQGCVNGACKHRE